MPSLNTNPNSSSKRAHQVLVMAGRRAGFDLAEIRSAVGGSIRRLSAQECSDWITHYGGGGLPNPPGKKPPAYRGKPREGTTRLISNDQVQQIARLAREYFYANASTRDGPETQWLVSNFKVKRLDTLEETVRGLTTAVRAGQVIAVLKGMITRRDLSLGRTGT